MIRSSEFNCMDFGRYIDWLRLAAQSQEQNLLDTVWFY